MVQSEINAVFNRALLTGKKSDFVHFTQVSKYLVHCGLKLGQNDCIIVSVTVFKIK